MARLQTVLQKYTSENGGMNQTTHELERQELLAECHSLVAVIGQHQYVVKLLRAARDGLRLYVGYKSRRVRSQVVR